ncbi:tumor protein p53-inducible nuclear protein 1 [Tachysurus vachellii]|uniref:tumor protein p53-inducible nuclear protein 1 n=1 Tax=Tachysurus vachellii TaxID=175792 RepID=UPI00296B4BD4|nr:tumor protein p53-inducible nuclear protein 1 [Tachysurus vachellii]
MISKILMQLLHGGAREEADSVVVENESCVELLESEDGDWIIINMSDHSSLRLLDKDPLENLLIEHPSMSVYQMFRQRTNEEDVFDKVYSPRCVQVRRDVSTLLGLWCGSVLFSDPRARPYSERRKLSRSSLSRQNLLRTRNSNTEHRYGHFKQPSQRLYNY